VPESLTALVATAIYQARSALVDPEPVTRTVALIARSAGSQATSFETTAEHLIVNGTVLELDAPGAVVVRDALEAHLTRRLILPARMSATCWREVVELFASAGGLYHSIDDLRDALRFSVPDAVVSDVSTEEAEGDLRNSLFELPGLRASGSGMAPTVVPDPREAELTELGTRLDPLLRAAERARDSENYEQLAHTLLAILALEDSNRDERRAIVARERRRVISTDVVEGMARQVMKPRAPAVIARVLGLLGHDGAMALMLALGAAANPHERRAVMDALTACRDCDDTIVDALNSPRPEIARDAAEVAGRRQLDTAVPFLTHLLRHAQADVRTASWHALEMIGTREAVKALRS
jgi:HEAT repeats